MDFFVVIVSVKVGVSVSATRFIVLFLEVRLEQLGPRIILIHSNVSRTGFPTYTLTHGVSKFTKLS